LPRRASPAETDTWVILNLLLASGAFLLLSAGPDAFHARRFFSMPLVGYGLLEVFATLVYEFRVALVDTGPVISYRRYAVLAIMNYVAALFWFALGYWVWSGFRFGRPITGSEALGASLFTQSLLGTSRDYGVLQLVQAGAGLFMTMIVLANAINAIQRGEKGDLEHMLDGLKQQNVECHLSDGTSVTGVLRGFEDRFVILDVLPGKPKRRTALIPLAQIRYVEAFVARDREQEP
jgi:hypothetical protein